MPLLKSVYNNGGSYSANESLDVPRLRITDGASDGVVLQWNASDQLAIDASVANDAILIGSTTATDLQLHGATASRDVIFDASVNELQVNNSAILRLGTASDGMTFSFDGTNNLAIDASAANDTITIGATTATDVSFQGATAGRDILFDASADALRALDNASFVCGTGSDLTISHDGTNTLITSATGDLTIDNTLATGSTILQLGTDTSATDFQVQNNTGTALLTVNGAGTITVPLANQVLHSAGFIVPCYSTTDYQALSGAGACDLLSTYTRWTTTAANAGTLAAPGSAVPPGFIKKVQLVSDGGDGTLTVTGLPAAHDVWVFSEVGQSITLMAVNSTTWVLVDDGMGDTTVGSMGSFS